MLLDSMVANPGRLRILTALASQPSQEFVQLRARSGLTDGNLASHARRLASAGLLEIEKHFRSGKPVTTLTLTEQGREALESHVRNLTKMIENRVAVDLTAEPPGENASEDEWVD